MLTLTRTHPAVALARRVQAMAGALGAATRRMQAEWWRRRVAADTWSVLRGLDDRILRDLGFDRSEIRSVAAEVAGAADPTRVARG